MIVIDEQRYSSPLHLFEMGPLEIQLDASEVSDLIDISVSGPAGELFKESYQADFDNRISVDLRPLLCRDFTFSLPSTASDTVQSGAVRGYTVRIARRGMSGALLSLTVLGCSSAALGRMSDIDVMRVPSDYIIPLGRCGSGSGSGVDFILPSGPVRVSGCLAASPGGLGLVSRLLPLSSSPAAGASSFKVQVVGTSVYSPHYIVASGPFEQYLFLNRLGGFDNLAMSGDLMLQAESAHETGKYGGMEAQRDSTVTRKWLQNSGFVSLGCVEAFASLVCSGQAYHLKDGSWQRIVILESSVQHNTAADLHSFSFKYKYTDEAVYYRPFT